VAGYGKVWDVVVEEGAEDVLGGEEVGEIVTLGIGFAGY
jgi:hypothetical protein